MTAITDEMLIAYVDGELSEADRTLVASAVAADPALFEKLEQHRRFRARMFGAFAGVLDEPVPERLVEAARPSKVVSLAERRRKHTRRTEGARASVHPAYVSSNGQGTSPADDRETAPASPSGHLDTPWPAGHEGTTPMAGPHEPPPPGEHPGTTFQADRHEPSPTPAGGREAPSVADRDTLPPPPDKDLGPTHLSPTIRCTPPRGSGGARPRKPTTSGNTSMTRRAVVG